MSQKMKPRRAPNPADAPSGRGSLCVPCHQSFAASCLFHLHKVANAASTPLARPGVVYLNIFAWRVDADRSACSRDSAREGEMPHPPTPRKGHARTPAREDEDRSNRNNELT